MNCKSCNKEFFEEKFKWNKRGYCSKKCYYGSMKFKIRYFETFVSKFEKDFKYTTFDELHQKYYFYKKKELDKSQIKMVKTIKKNTGFHILGIKASITRKLNFLLENKIIDNKDISDKTIDSLFKTYFNRITNHGQKILNGMIRKYGKENISAIKREQQNLYILNKIRELGYDIERLSDNDLKKIKHELYKGFNRRTEKDILSWKIKHIVKFYKKDFTDFDNIDEINRLYSEYVSIRMKRIAESLLSGWKNTRKGFYIFKNIKSNKFFYRSSWELKVLETLDCIAKEQPIISCVTLPNSILYNYENRIHRYFPNICVNNSIVFEIKPKFKAQSGIDLIKIEEGKKHFGNNFYILTEEEIFGGDLKQILLNIIKGRQL